MTTVRTRPMPTTRDRILDAAERLLARFGYKKTTMEDIAREAGLGKRTLYLHFPSKEAVALSTIDRIVDRLTGQLREVAAAVGPPEERLREMLLRRVLVRFDSVRHYSHSLDELFESLRPAYMARRARYFAAEAQVVADLLAEGRRLGAFACDDPEATAHTLLLATNSLLPYSLTARELGKREDVKQKALRIVDLLLAGLRPRQTAPHPREKSS